MSELPELILASASPRRLELLGQIGVACRVMPVIMSEQPLAGELPLDYVSRLAREKARLAFEDARPIKAGQDSASTRKIIVLGADTTVVLGDLIMGKPANRKEARAMLSRLSGQEHRVLTAVAVTDGKKSECRVSDTRVRFREISAQEIDAYWDTGEPLDKAGSYAIQGKAAVFVREISGSYSGVVGLPLLETSELLRLFNVPCWQKNKDKT